MSRSGVFQGLSRVCVEEAGLWAQRDLSSTSSLGADEWCDLNFRSLSFPVCKWENTFYPDERADVGKLPVGPWICTSVMNASSSVNPAQSPTCFPHLFTRVENCLLFVFTPDLSVFLTIYVYVCILVVSGQLLMHIQTQAVRIENDSNVCCPV